MSRVLPILFNTDMVRAILDGRKTVTRRLVKFRPGENPNWTGYIKDGLMLYNGRNEQCCRTAPYQPGDILYVRETWCEFPKRKYHYKADGMTGRDNKYFEAVTDTKWRSSIHMPKEAARIWLKVTDVRVERLQNITDDDCMNEGIRAWTKDGKLYKYFTADEEGDYPNCAWSECPRTPMEAMERIWSSTIKKSDLDNYGWNANPWVWIIEFERCEKPEILEELK